MALPTRHFKIGFNSFIVSRYAVKKEESHYAKVIDTTVGLFKFVVEGMKFSYDYIIDRRSGGQLSDGNWTGIIGRLNRSEIDYAPAALILTEEGWDAAAFNYPYANDELVFFTRTAEYSPGIMALFQTLSLNVWLSLLACIILFTLVCFVAMKHWYTLDDILLHVFAIGLNQEGNLVPKRAGEILLLCTWLFSMAVFTFCFKSVLLSFLAFPPVTSVKTVPELAAAIRAGQYIAVTNNDDDFGRYLQSSPVDDYRVIGESMIKHRRHALESLLAREFSFKKAYVYRRSNALVTNSEWYVSKDSMGSLYFATAVSKTFCFKDEMDMFIHRFLAAGIDQKIHRFRRFLYRWISEDDEFFRDSEIKRKITLTDISGALILLVSGHCLSVFVLIIECLVKRRERRRTVVRTMRKSKHRPKNKSFKN